MKLEEIEPLMRVGYVPMHDKNAVETGIVSSKNSKYVFVKPLMNATKRKKHFRSFITSCSATPQNGRIASESLMWLRR